MTTPLSGAPDVMLEGPAILDVAPSEHDLAAGDLKSKTLRGGAAKVGSQAATFVLRVGSLMVMARLLEPRDFGLVGMVTVVTGVFGLFRDVGLSMVTVQRATISEGQVSTLFWINLLVGAILAVLSIAVAPGLVVFYKEPRLFWVTAALATGFVLNAAGVQHSALLQRHMRFTAVAVIEIVSQVAGTAVGIGMGVAGYGYWALVAMALTLPATATVGAWIATGWMPGAPRRNVGVRAMMRFGGAVTLNSVIVYVAYNVDKVLLGRLWGAAALGIYGRAYQLINIPTDNLNSAVGSVAISALSRLQDDERRFKGYFLKGYSLVLALTVPVTVACAVFADDIITVLLGAKWLEAIPIFRALAPTILAFALINPGLAAVRARPGQAQPDDGAGDRAAGDPGLRSGRALRAARRGRGLLGGDDADGGADDRMGHPRLVDLPARRVEGDDSAPRLGGGCRGDQLRGARLFRAVCRSAPTAGARGGHPRGRLFGHAVLGDGAGSVLPGHRPKPARAPVGSCQPRPFRGPAFRHRPDRPVPPRLARPLPARQRAPTTDRVSLPQNLGLPFVPLTLIPGVWVTPSG